MGASHTSLAAFRIRFPSGPLASERVLLILSFFISYLDGNGPSSSRRDASELPSANAMMPVWFHRDAIQALSAKEARKAAAYTTILSFDGICGQRTCRKCGLALEKYDKGNQRRTVHAMSCFRR
ncbi:hypothetical protein NMY22_g6611 [Coprinellus aureogranulatus]|nr:hypothetical protein NMY22_g6611 [Coprinellus aureogranulatus]